MFNQEPFSQGKTFLHRTAPQVKIILTFLLLFCIASLNTLHAGLMGLGFCFILLALSKPPLSPLIHRVILVNVFVLLIWLFLPLTFQGNILFTIGPLSFKEEGVQKAFLITIKANSILFGFISLFLTTPIFENANGMSRLKVPQKLISIFLLTLRYNTLIINEFQRIQQALKLKGFKPGSTFFTYKVYSQFLSILFIRAYDRSDRIYQAMLCRGYQGNFNSNPNGYFKVSALLLTITIFVVISFLISLDRGIL